MQIKSICGVYGTWKEVGSRLAGGVCSPPLVDVSINFPKQAHKNPIGFAYLRKVIEKIDPSERHNLEQAVFIIQFI